METISLLNSKLNKWIGTEEVDYSNDISACFRWLVPVICKDRLVEIQFGYSDAEKAVRCQIVRFFLPTSSNRSELLASEFGETESQSLCLAIEKLIDEEELEKERRE